MDRNRRPNRNLKISKALHKSQAHEGTSLFTSAATNQRGFPKRGSREARGPISRVPGGDRVAVRAGVRINVLQYQCHIKLPYKLMQHKII